jgi:hypothetical protein
MRFGASRACVATPHGPHGQKLVPLSAHAQEGPPCPPQGLATREESCSKFKKTAALPPLLFTDLLTNYVQVTSGKWRGFSNHRIAVSRAVPRIAYRVSRRITYRVYHYYHVSHLLPIRYLSLIQVGLRRAQLAASPPPGCLGGRGGGGLLPRLPCH